MDRSGPGGARNVLLGRLEALVRTSPPSLFSRVFLSPRCCSGLNSHLGKKMPRTSFGIPPRPMSATGPRFLNSIIPNAIAPGLR